MFEQFVQLHAMFIDAERIPFAIAAIFVVMIVGIITGAPTGNANPFIWSVFDAMFGHIGDKMGKVERHRADLVFRGFLISALALFMALAFGKLYTIAKTMIGYSSVVEIVGLSLLLSVGTIWFALLKLYFALEEKGDVEKGAYFTISRSTRRNLNAGDDFAITRMGMGMAARNFDKCVVAPVFWYIVGGIPVALVYSAICALAWRFGKDGFSKGLGTIPLTLEKLFGLVPSVMSAAFITLAAMFTPTAKMGKSLSSLWTTKNRASYAQGGMPLTALAWALNVSLGGASQDTSGSAIKGAWVGPEGASAKNDHKHLRRALYISVMTHFLFIVSLACAYLWSAL